MWNRTSDLWIPRCNALPLSHRDSVVSEVYYEIEVHMTRVLHTARINYVDSVMSSRGIGIFFCPTLVTRRKKISLFLYRAQNLLSFLFYL